MDLGVQLFGILYNTDKTEEEALGKLKALGYDFVEPCVALDPVPGMEKVFWPVDSLPELSRPVLTAPRQNLLMDFAYLRKNRTIVFSWEPVAGASDYSFALYKKEAGGALSPVWSEKGVKNTQVKLKKLSLLDLGDFVWNVTAYSHAKDGYEEQQGRAATGSFRVSFDRPQKVQPIQPEPMYAE